MLAPRGKEPGPKGPKEVSDMRETCYCGRTGEIEDRRAVRDADGREALACRDCGHLDHLSWLPPDARGRSLAEAKRRTDGETMPLTA
jgi:hypothetical protein